MYDDALPVTGAGALTLGSWTLGLPTVVTIAAALILAGVLAYRAASWGKRRAARG
ncbi:hypothetical protein [Nocardiopsis dassonvillei]|uniref:hypothetical protein n=1 Tax=Nocardiopsis dassonvillei TaxID=2014 RepID=UPI0036315844